MEITQEEFMEKYLPGLRDAFVQKTQEHITRQLPEIQKKLKKNMDALLEILGRIQEEAPVAAGESSWGRLRWHISCTGRMESLAGKS